MSILSKINYPEDLQSLSYTEMLDLVAEVRDFLITSVAQTGGHLASNLGVVELTIALHTVFNVPEDSILWDVGHQSYVHKILTGRKKLFPNLRKKKGLSGFTDPSESIYDLCHAGHSSTSVSLAVGIATAKLLNNDPSTTLAVIGDGAFTSGMVYEAVNDAIGRDLPLIVVLNDNKMSISENVGGIARHLSFLRSHKMYLSLKKEVVEFLSKLKCGEFLKHVLYSIKFFVKRLFYKKYNVFDSLGFTYLGPFDGHDLGQLITLFRSIANTRKPVLIHLITEKGRGDKKSEEDPVRFHGIKGSEGGSVLVPRSHKESWSQVFGREVCNLAEKNKNIVVLTAAMAEGTGLVDFAKKYPRQFIDVGIAESHAVACAVGLAIQKKKPIIAIYSTFLQRGYDQIIHDVAIGAYNVVFCVDRAGLVAGDGATHQGIFDISYCRSIPGMLVLSPLFDLELGMMIRFALSYPAPVVIRYPKDFAPCSQFSLPQIVLGQGFEVNPGTDGVIVIFGSLYYEALSLRNQLQAFLKNYAIYHLRFAKPISDEVLEYFRTKKTLICLEEGVRSGGIGEFLQSQLRGDVDCILRNIDNEFPGVDSREGLINEFIFNEESILDELLDLEIIEGLKNEKCKLQV